MDYDNLIKRLDACVFTVIDPQLASEAATAIRLLLEQVATTGTYSRMNQIGLRAAVARLMYNDNKDSSDYNALIEFIDSAFRSHED